MSRKKALWTVIGSALLSVALAACGKAPSHDDPTSPVFRPTASSPTSPEKPSTPREPEPSAPGPTGPTGATGPGGEKPPPEELADGSFARPFVVSLPTVVTGDTRTEGHVAAATYSCAPATDESGRELVYTFTTAQDGVLTATLDDVSGDLVDIDVHLLSAATPDACIARHNVSLSAAVVANKQYWLVADTWVKQGNALAGPFSMRVDFIPRVPPGEGDCPTDMQPVAGTCMDRYEAPNRLGEKPFVMFNFNEAEAWCSARQKRLCFDDEWTLACGGAANTAYPYGDVYTSTLCNTAQPTVSYSESLIAAWPANVSTPEVESLDALFAKARATKPIVADHLQSIYLGTASGDFPQCTNELGVLDTMGNVEEWTRRRDGGEVRNGVRFSGNLKGRFWSQVRKCQENLTPHADPFRYYEIGFRCCADRPSR